MEKALKNIVLTKIRTLIRIEVLITKHFQIGGIQFKGINISPMIKYLHLMFSIEKGKCKYCSVTAFNLKMFSTVLII